MEVIKQLRQREIRDLLAQRPIRTQQELAAALRDRGFRATQATISRDVADLGLIKSSQDGVQTYTVPARVTEAESTGEERLRALLHDLPVDIRESGLMLVIKTLPGSAHAIAAALDRTRWPEVVGSIAGDDTVFVAFADRALMQRVRGRLVLLGQQRALVPGGSSRVDPGIGTGPGFRGGGGRMPEGGAGVVGFVGADIDQSRFSNPLHIGTARVGTSVLMPT